MMCVGSEQIVNVLLMGDLSHSREGFDRRKKAKNCRMMN